MNEDSEYEQAHEEARVAIEEALASADQAMADADRLKAETLTGEMVPEGSGSRG